MKNLFNVVVIALGLLVAFTIYFIIFGNGSNFGVLGAGGKILADPTKAHPINVLGNIYTGGPLVALLVALIIISITFIIERLLTIIKARGKGNVAIFIKNVQMHLINSKYDEALAECGKQRGSLANIIRAAVERFKEIEKDQTYHGEKRLVEIQRIIDEAMNLETPLLEKNLVILSTVASISTMVGLHGTTIGMIRSFQALGAEGGTIDAVKLSIGISEALYNTAGGLAAAIISIVAYNFFTTLVDNYVYMIDEAVLGVTQIFTQHSKS